MSMISSRLSIDSPLRAPEERIRRGKEGGARSLCAPCEVICQNRATARALQASSTGQALWPGCRRSTMYRSRSVGRRASTRCRWLRVSCSSTMMYATARALCKCGWCTSPRLMQRNARKRLLSSGKKRHASREEGGRRRVRAAISNLRAKMRR